MIKIKNIVFTKNNSLYCYYFDHGDPRKKDLLKGVALTYDKNKGYKVEDSTVMFRTETYMNQYLGKVIDEMFCDKCRLKLISNGFLPDNRFYLF